MLTDAEQFIRYSDSVYIGMFSVVKIRVWPPNPLEHLDGKGQRADGTEKRQPRVTPILPEVAIHRIILNIKNTNNITIDHHTLFEYCLQRS